MKKKILLIGYSQTGQLYELMQRFILPFSDADIETIHLSPKTPYPFPWTSKEFFDVMPESVLEKGMELLPYSFQSSHYDLIIIGYQPWYLSPSIPTIALFNNKGFLALIKDTPIITLIGSRNMWLSAQESIKKKIKAAGGRLVGNIPFIDRNNNHVSVVTILYWMLTGKKDRFLKVFPKPGISTKDIDSASKYGEIVNSALHNNQFDNLQARILGLGWIDIKIDILFIDSKAKKLFTIWANTIMKKGTSKRKREIWIRVFKYYLLIALFIVAPIVLLFYSILILPFTRSLIKRKKMYYCNV